ncbi:structural maintenance of chromosomes protein 1A [Glossina fuscipes]|uniref:Structural maintenance of chromosomes protein n=2 Tax=Nemorhina TaxID=44051 RepID=A0A9C5YXM0_9MUSC|nr:structural maintenance of chromosomes protein 1A [Glossina fuscipes]XP_037891150.1 structural maintenance of chromosomes protein 1A [Glossina fuscipes]
MTHEENVEVVAMEQQPAEVETVQVPQPPPQTTSAQFEEEQAFLQYIEMDNFKSYQGRVVVGPLKQFTAVIGPNGSGKSNFMDAISFVMGEKTSSLRVKRLNDLIHGSSIGKPVARSCYVIAKFIINGDRHRDFKRAVIGGSSEYRINEEPVSSSVYLAKLEKLGINVKAKNFLVFQGAVENIAMKTPKERTALFEEISGSGLLKEEYNRLKHEMILAEEETQFTYQKKKGIAAERKEAKYKKMEAERYTRLKKEYTEKQIEYQLFRLYHVEKDIQKLNVDLESKQKEIKKVEMRKEQADDVLREKKKEAGTLNRELAKVDQEIREFETQMNKKHPLYIKAKEKVAHCQKKLSSLQKTLETAREADNAHQQDIRKLEKQLQEVEQMKKRFEDEIENESHRRGKSVHMEEGLVQEYDQLKQQAEATATRYRSELDSVNREQKSDQDMLDGETNRRASVEEALKKLTLQREEAVKRRDKLMDHINSSKAALEEQNRIKDELKRDVGSSKEKIAEIQRELENVRDQLGDAKSDKHEDARRKKKQEVVELFKKQVPGVYDRMINMCQPTHKRYNVAVTKVLGKFMEAIIVDTEKTARQCIQILKEQMLEVETFLPLDYLQVKPLKERLRNITEPRNVKLVYDVLKFEPKEIERAVLFATGNALVCETPEDAMKVAYELDRSRYDALALDGTFYQKSGLISGGSHDLARKAKRWDEKHMAQLKMQKERLNEELKELVKKSRKQSELATVESQIKGLENRLKYSMVDSESSRKSIEQFDTQLQQVQSQLDEFGPKIGEIERRMQNRDQNIQTIKENMNNVEDQVFANFCKRLGVKNIRQYEERELIMQQERARKRAEFEQQIDAINTQLDFEKQKDTKKNVERWERSVQDEEDALEGLRAAEKRYLKEIDVDKERMEQYKQEKNAKKQAVDDMEEEISKARREVANLAKEVHNMGSQLSSIEAKIEAKKNERHNILMQAKMDCIAVPLLKGSLDDAVRQGDSESGTNSNSTSLILERENRIEVDYQNLPRDLCKLKDDSAFKKTNEQLQKELQNKLEVLERIQTPNMKAMQKLDRVTEKVQSTNEEFENARRKAKKAKAAFEKVKSDRIEKFTMCCNHILEAIDGIYKKLARNEAAQAYLSPDNPEEPYLDGINYNCVAPGKRFQPMSNLSGGEKTIAALALLFSIHSYQPAPFFVLDEIDAALDNTNIGKVASYIRDHTTNLQTIVISLKEEFYGHADALVGITPGEGDCLVSNVYLFDLTEFEDRY